MTTGKDIEKQSSMETNGQENKATDLSRRTKQHTVRIWRFTMLYILFVIGYVVVADLYFAIPFEKVCNMIVLLMLLYGAILICLLFKRRLDRRRRESRIAARQTKAFVVGAVMDESMKAGDMVLAREDTGEEGLSAKAFTGQGTPGQKNPGQENQKGQVPETERLYMRSRRRIFRERRGCAPAVRRIRRQNSVRERHLHHANLLRVTLSGAFVTVIAACLALSMRHSYLASISISESEHKYASSRTVSSISEIFREFVGSSSSSAEIPEKLLAFAEKYPEAADFVNSYPEKKDIDYEIDLSGEVEQGTIPLFIQWDERWGYRTYGSNLMGLNGCGPTCLSMVICGLTGDTKWDPYSVAQYSEEQDYYVSGVGTSWALMTTGAEALGLAATEGTISASYIQEHLSASTPMIASMLPGDFTYSGHFIVLTGIDEDGNVSVNDPNSPLNSAKTWTLDTLVPQIKGLWVYSFQDGE